MPDPQAPATPATSHENAASDVDADQDGTVVTSEECNDVGVLLEESKAIAMYVARHGDALGTDDSVKELYPELLNAIARAYDQPTTENWQTLAAAYKNFTAVTYAARGVNGRTVLDTQKTSKAGLLNRFRSPKYRPVCIGVALFIAAMMLEFLISWVGRESDPASLKGFVKFLYDFADALAQFLIPAAWGGIGACIFLMKRLSDKLFEMAYEESRVRGDVTRVFLGSMLGVVIVVLFFPEFGEKIKLGDVSFGPSTAAFLAGLGVKPVYAAFESLSEEIARRVQSKKKEGDA